VKVLARAEHQDAARAIAGRAAAAVREKLGPWILGEGPGSAVDFMAAALRAKKLTLALAESCTGGLVAQLITEQPASDYFSGGVVVYANEAKTSLLAVPKETLEKHGAVSKATAIAMAEGCRRVLESDLAVAITGIAGPTGGTAEKPVGLVHVALATKEGTEHHELNLRGDRFRVQRMAAFSALKYVLAYARGD
jgi:nicotinamide-nucleotide amidase